jgi:hypothetical protein
MAKADSGQGEGRSLDMDEALNHARQLGNADHAVRGELADVGPTHVRKYAHDANVAENDELVIAAHLFEGSLEIVPRVLGVFHEQFGVRPATRAGVSRRPSRSGSSPAHRIRVACGMTPACSAGFPEGITG